MSKAAQKRAEHNEVYFIPPEYVMRAWEKAEGILQRVVKPADGYSVDHVLNEIQLGKMQLWVIGDFKGVIVTSILEKPLHRVLWGQYLAGDHMDEWLDGLLQTLDQYAAHNDCATVEFNGRKGWSKIQKHHSEYKPVATIYRRTL